METLSFTLGVLSVIIAAFIAVLVWGVVKVVKQQKQISSFEKEIENVYRHMNESSSNMHNRLGEMDRQAYQTLQNYEREVEQKFERTHREMDDRLDSVYLAMDHDRKSTIEQSKSYTDSRIDKLIDTYSEIGSKKQVIKG